VSDRVDPALSGRIWLLYGLTRSEPGMLELAHGRLTCRTNAGIAFDLPIADVRDLVFPWYYFGGGMKLTAAGVRHRISFVRPNDAVEDLPFRIAAREGDAAGLALVGMKARDIGDGRAAGRAWRHALESARG